MVALPPLCVRFRRRIRLLLQLPLLLRPVLLLLLLDELDPLPLRRARGRLRPPMNLRELLCILPCERLELALQLLNLPCK